MAIMKARAAVRRKSFTRRVAVRGSGRLMAISSSFQDVCYLVAGPEIL
jgi:hypothetical protein